MIKIEDDKKIDIFADNSYDSTNLYDKQFFEQKIRICTHLKLMKNTVQQ